MHPFTIPNPGAQAMASRVGAPMPQQAHPMQGAMNMLKGSTTGADHQGMLIKALVAHLAKITPPHPGNVIAEHLKATRDAAAKQHPQY